jgi:hypothetical protein
VTKANFIAWYFYTSLLKVEHPKDKNSESQDDARLPLKSLREAAVDSLIRL